MKVIIRPSKQINNGLHLEFGKISISSPNNDA